MKRFATGLVLVLGLLLLTSPQVMAGEECAKSAKHATAMKACCLEAGQAGKGCCGKDAETVKAAYTAHMAHKTARAEMHGCCVEAMDAGKGCCGKDAKALKASYEGKVASATAACEVKAGMGQCCLVALESGKGCCGKSAEDIKSGYEEKVTKTEQKMANK